MSPSSTRRSPLRGWHCILAGVAVYGGIVLALSTPSDPTRGLRLLGVPPDRPAFGDLHNVLAGVDCSEQGYDVLVNNPCDAMGRPMNYPRIWLALGLLGLDRSWTRTLGWIFLVAFVVALTWLLRATRVRDAPVALGFVLSPAAVLLVERGNNDVVAFCCLVAATTAMARSTLSRRLAGYLLVVVAGMLKLYPVVAGVAVLREKRERAAIVGGAMTVVFAGYCVLTLEAIRKIARVVPEEPFWSYGLGVLPRQIGLQLEQHGIELSDDAGRTIAYLALGCLAAAGVFWGRRIRARASVEPAEEGTEARVAFTVGATVYVATFAAGFNWDYRLVFLLFCYPLMSGWRRTPSRRRLAVAFFAASIGLAWSSFFIPAVYVPSLSLTFFPHVDGLLSWLVLLCCLTGLVLQWPFGRAAEPTEADRVR